MKPGIQHKINWMTQQFSKNNIRIVGGYHYGNIGDMAMGMSAKEFLEIKGLPAQLQTIYNLKYWPNKKYTILGGGAIGYTFCLNQIQKSLKGDFKQLGICGVDFNEKNYPDSIIEMLSKAAFISTRSKSQAELISALTQRKDIKAYPDLAFAYRISTYKKIRSPFDQSNCKPRLLFNMVPLYGQLKGAKLVVSKQYEQERPEIIHNHANYLSAYIGFIKSHVRTAIEQGIDVVHIPFTPSDEAYAKMVFKEPEIIHLPYSSDPRSIEFRINPTDKFITTRFHATLFAIRSGASVLPIAYAKKNEELLSALGWENHEFFRLTENIDKKIDTIPFKKIDYSIIDRMEEKAKEGLVDCLTNLKLI
jgi:hypothetical protein